MLPLWVKTEYSNSLSHTGVRDTVTAWELAWVRGDMDSFLLFVFPDSGQWLACLPA